jgi:hypothetical protein
VSRVGAGVLGGVECQPLGCAAAICVPRSWVRNISVVKGDMQEKYAEPCVHLYKHSYTVARSTLKIYSK